MRVILSAMIMMVVAACVAPENKLQIDRRYSLIDIELTPVSRQIAYFDRALFKCWLKSGGMMESYELLRVSDGHDHIPASQVHVLYYLRDKASEHEYEDAIIGLMGVRGGLFSAGIMSPQGNSHPLIKKFQPHVRMVAKNRYICDFSETASDVNSDDDPAPSFPDITYYYLKSTPIDASSFLETGWKQCWPNNSNSLSEKYKYTGFLGETKIFDGRGFKRDYGVTGPQGENYVLSARGFAGRSWTTLAIDGVGDVSQAGQHELLKFMRQQAIAYEKSGTPFCDSPAP